VRFYRGELTESLDAYREAISLSPGEAVFHFNLSVALFRKGESGAAESARAEALRLDPELRAPEDGHPIL
jgi:Flp pilus assembly protein TadD